MTISKLSTKTLVKFENCLISEILKLDCFSENEIKNYVKSIIDIYKVNGINGSPEVFKTLEKSSLRQKWNVAFRFDRSKFVANWVNKFCNTEILDLVCGDGGVGEELEKLGKNVLYSENQHYNFSISNHIPLEQLMENKISIKTDTVILGAVIHHNPLPNELIKLAFDSANKNVIIYENPIDDYFDDELHSLIDSFFNDGLNSTGDECPGNHKTDLEWKNTFSKFGEIIHFEKNIIVPGNPLPHSLFIVNKI
jgi:hypothetical protein